MKKTTILLILLSCFQVFIIEAQQKEIDSLDDLIENYRKIDTTYINLRIEYVSKKLFLTPTDSTWLDYNIKTLELSEDINYPKGIALSYEKIGIIYQHILSDPYRAIDNYQKSIDIIDKHPSLKKYALGNYGNIGNIYYEQGEFRKALGRYKKILNYDNQNIGALANFGNVYGELSKADSAIYYYKKAIKIAKKSKNYLYEANSLSNLSLIQSRAKQHTEALKSIKESLKIINKYQLEYLRTSAYLNAAMVYLGNGNLDEAESYSKKALALKESLNNLAIQKSIWETFAEVYEKKGDYLNALMAYKKFTKLNDSISSQDRKLEISRKEIQFEADKKQTIATAEISKQKIVKNISILAGSFIFFTSIIGLIYYKRRRDNLEQKSVAEFNAKVADTELKALRAQLNPHFIFNSLNSINDYIAKNDKNEASDYLIKFFNLTRKTLENSEKKEIILQDDLDLLKNYLEIESKRLHKKFTYNFIIAKDIDTTNILVPPLILQPFIENSIWHGISNKKDIGKIQIEVKKSGSSIIYAVDDNGIGRTKNQNKIKSKNSFGMKITKNRIEIINHQKKSNGSVFVIDKEQGLRVEVQLPLTLAF